MEEKFLVYVIIATYNGEKWIEKCVKSINASSYPCKLVVVDNCSSDNTIEIIKKTSPIAQIFELKKNCGFGQANNIGIQYAYKKGADFFFLLNQDAYLQESSIEKLVFASIKYPNYGILSPIHLNGKGTAFDFGFSVYVRASNCKDLYKHYGQQQRDTGYGPVCACPFINAAAWLLPKKTIENVGGFDPLFFHYGEDRNYASRVLYHGFKIGIVPNASILHDRTKEQILQRPVNYERNKLVKFCNIQKRSTLKIGITLLSLLLKTIASNFLFVRRNKKEVYLSRLRWLLAVTPSIHSSRKRNKTVGRHYLKPKIKALP